MIALSPQAIVRAQARKALQHKYAKAVAALVTALLPVFLIDTATVVLICVFSILWTDSDLAGILSFAVLIPVQVILGVLLSPFINGYIRVYYRNALTDEMDFKDLWYYFDRERYSHTLQLNLSFILRLVLPGFLFYLPLIIYEVVSLNMKNNFYGSMLYNDFYFLLAVMSTVILTLYSLKYFTVFTLHIENEDLSIGELFQSSRRIMSSQSADAAKLIFSYTPWMLLCLTILPMLYVVPYMTQGLCIGAKWMTRAAKEESI